MNIRIVLVEPQQWGNVGAAARAMKNFGVRDLWIVGNREQQIDPSATWWAAGAEEVIADAKRVDTLFQALRDTHLSIATTAARKRFVHEQLTPRSAADVARETLNEAHTLAIVFGREESGLRAEEIARCQRTATIPTMPDFPTMNLAQAVSIFCYELALSTPAPEPKELPNAELLSQLHSHVRLLVDHLGVFNGKDGDRAFAELQALGGRALLTMRDVSLLLGIVRRIERALGIADKADG